MTIPLRNAFQPANAPSGGIYLFAGFKLDCGGWKFYRDNVAIALAPKLMETLAYLARHAGRVVSYESLMKDVWSGSVVSRGALSRNIAIIRNTLRDEYPYQLIKTITNRGYMFCPAVTIQSDGIMTSIGGDIRHATHQNSGGTARSPATVSKDKPVYLPGLIYALTLSLIMLAAVLLVAVILV
jgi:DNA-binding winged helix-turn-helix (wHTH) protein